MEKIVASICFLLNVVFSFAQHMPLVGDVWYYEQSGPTGNPYQASVFKLVAEKDTLINGKNSLVVAQYQLHKVKAATPIKKFYFLDSSGFVSTLDNNIEIPFFDFNAQQGDSVVVNYFENNLQKLFTTKVYIDSILLDEFGLRQFYFTTETSNMISERVFKYDIVSAFNQTAAYYPSTPESVVPLRCYNANGIQIKMNPNQDCDLLQPHFFNLTSQYYYSMHKPHTSVEAPFYRLVYQKDTNDSTIYWLRYESKNGTRIPEADVQVKEDKTTQKVFAWKSGWHLLYDLKAKKGDTIFSTAAIDHPLWINNNGSSEAVANWSYIIDSVYESFNQIIQIPKPVAGSKWTMPGRIYEGMGSTVSFLGLPIQTDTVGDEGSLRCYFNENWINYRNPSMDVQSCNSLFSSINEEGDKTRLLFSIYPNPASDYVIISGLTGGFEATIYNTAGEKVASSNSAKLDVSNLPDGMYMLKLTNGRFAAAKAILLKH
ncbi:MAG: T9SS type A sorting domain-containing protein [Bacteroidia bacterium]|jgi:hypothetical protein|nr:T9SS type A sorting domain-containing protein [Bacteroidia bacterium]